MLTQVLTQSLLGVDLRQRGAGGEYDYSDSEIWQGVADRPEQNQTRCSDGVQRHREPILAR